VILLTGVFVVLAAIFGMYAISNFVATGEAQPLLDADGNATTQYVTISHQGGETLRTSDLDVVVRGETRQRYDLESFTQREGDDASRFEPGDRFRHPNGVEGTRLTYLLIHEPSNALIDRVEVDVVVTIAARFSTSPDRPTQGETVAFDAGDSEVRGSTLTKYEWDFGADGSVDATGVTTTQSYADDGTYPVSLTITAADGRTATRTEAVEVFNERPTASFTASPTLVAPGSSVSFDASGSSDDSAIASYEWDFGDGTTASGATSSHAYSSVGNYTVNLAVTDDDGAVDSATRTISVRGAVFGASITGTNSPVTEGETLTVDAEVSNTGAASGTQAVTLSINGTQEASQSVTLDAGETTTISLDWATGPGDAQADPYLATVATENTTDSTFVNVIQQQAILQINDVRGLTDQPWTHNYQPEIDVEETNDVETDGLAVELAITNSNGLEVFNQTKSAPSDFAEIRNEVITSTFNVGQLDPGSYSYTVETRAANAAAVTSSGSFSVRGSMASRTELRGARTGSQISTVEFDLENTGSTAAEIRNLSYDATTSGAGVVQNQGQPELEFTNGGSVNLGGNAGIVIDTTVYGLDTNEVIDAGTTTTGTSEDFLDEYKQGNTGGNPIDMGGEDLTITLGFTDGSERTYTLQISP
jgi:PKD repeat protein